MRQVLCLVSLFCGLMVLSGCAMDRNAQNRYIIQEVKKMELEADETPRGVEIHFPATLLFDFNSDALKTESQAKLQRVAGIVNIRGIVTRPLVSEGYTDGIGSQESNLVLSQKRAESVANALVFSGVARERVTVKGFGKENPVAPNTKPDGSDNPEGRALNRRVELVVEN